MKLIIFFTFLKIEYLFGNLSIEFQVNNLDAHVNYSGNIVDKLNTVEASAWELYPENICSSNLGNIMGTRPDNCYYSKENPYKLYEVHGHEEVYSIYNVEKLDLSYFKQKQISENIGFFYNDMYKSKNVTIDIKIPLVNKIISKSNNSYFCYNRSMNYNLYLNKMKIEYSHFIGSNDVLYSDVIIPVKYKILLPGNYNITFIARYIKNEGIINSIFVYSMRGSIAVKFNNKYKDHYIWFKNSQRILNNPNCKKTNDVLEFYLVSNVEIILLLCNILNNYCYEKNVGNYLVDSLI